MIAACNRLYDAKRTVCAAVALLLATLAACTALASLPSSAWAVEEDWTVTFTGSSMTSDGTANINKTLAGMQPGDSAVFDVKLFNKCNEEASWYMKNSVLKSMEDEFAKSGSYTYRLTYIDPEGKEETIIGNETVSGDATDGGKTEGLFDATSATGEWFFLDKLPAQAKGQVRLFVAIDPETHGNKYFNTSAQLKLEFAAEASSGQMVTENGGGNTPKDTGGFKLPSTGDMVKFGLLIAVAIAALITWRVVHRRSSAKGEGGE